MIWYGVVPTNLFNSTHFDLMFGDDGRSCVAAECSRHGCYQELDIWCLMMVDSILQQILAITCLILFPRLEIFPDGWTYTKNSVRHLTMANIMKLLVVFLACTPSISK